MFTFKKKESSNLVYRYNNDAYNNAELVFYTSELVPAGILIIRRLCLTVSFLGFVDLSQDDQLILIKVGFFELWLCYVSRLATDLSLTFYDGTFITRQQLELIYDVSILVDIIILCTSQDHGKTVYSPMMRFCLPIVSPYTISNYIRYNMC